MCWCCCWWGVFFLFFFFPSVLCFLQALSDPYFYGLANVEDEPSTHPISKFEFDFERRKLTKDDARELIYREVLSQLAILISDDLFVFLLFTMILIQFEQILEYHPQMLREYLEGVDHTHFMYPRFCMFYNCCSIIYIYIFCYVYYLVLEHISCDSFYYMFLGS